MFKLVKAHFHKDKAVLAAFLLILIVATMLLQVGRMVARFDSMYDDKLESRGVSDAMYFISGDREDITDKVDQMDNVESFYLVDMIFPEDVTAQINNCKEKDFNDIFFVDETNESAYQNLNYISRDDSVTGAKIYVNVYTASSEGLCVGDRLKLQIPQIGDYEFTVAGIYEDLFCGQRYSYYSTIIDHNTYEKINEKAEVTLSKNSIPMSMMFLCVKFVDGADIATATSHLQDDLIKEGIFCNGYSKILAKAGYTGITNIIAAFMTAFSAIIMIIAFIMIIFTVNTNINRDIRNIGALRAVGFTISQVRMSLMIEYSIVAAIAGGIGIALAYGLFPVLEMYATRQLSGLVWEGGFHPCISLPVFVGIILVMVAVTFVATHLIRNIHPATALRFGLESHSFKKNYLPLDKVNGGLNSLLALKSTLQNKGQNIIVIGVILAVSYMTAFSAILFYNTKVDITNFQRLLQGDAPDAYVNITYDTPEEMNDIIDTLQNMEEVSQAYGLGNVDGHAGDYNCYILYSDKPEDVYCGIYEGEMAIEANEAIVGGLLAENLGLGIGDEITIKYQDKEATYLITGLQQAVYSMGERIYISDKGFERLEGEPKYTYVRVRLNNPSEKNVDEFLMHAESVLGSNCTSTENYYHTQRSTENVPVYAVALVILVLIVLNIFTVAIVIRLLLKTVFIKREKEFGIKKAVGFTSRQLRLQLSISLMPLCIIGSLLGSIVACFTTNSLFNVIFNSYGIKNSDLLINPAVVPVALAIVSLMTFAISFVMSGKMKKVSAYKLISE